MLMTSDVNVHLAWQIGGCRIARQTVGDPFRDLIHHRQRVHHLVVANTSDARGHDVANAVHTGLQARESDAGKAFKDDRNVLHGQVTQLNLGAGGDVYQIVSKILCNTRDHPQLGAAGNTARNPNAGHQRAVFAVPEAQPFDALLVVVA